MLTTMIGALRDDDLAHHVTAVNEETRGVQNLKELADGRRIKDIGLTTQGTRYSASLEIKKPGSNLAILIPEGDDMTFAMARAYQMFSMDFRASVKIFHDLEEAMIWLVDDEVERKTLTSLINSL